MHCLSLLAYSVGWLRGGHIERLATAVLIAGYAYSAVTYRLRVGNFYWASALANLLVLLIFVWLAFRANRWWPLVATAAMFLIVLVHLITIVVPDLPVVAAVSAQLGLWLVADAAVLAGVAERWLAGEAAVSDGKTWRRRLPP